jgi:hypothetical protein
MNHQFLNRVSFLEPDVMDGLDQSALPTRLPAFCLGIQRDISPPLLFGGSRLQRMRVIIVEPASVSADPESDPLAELLPPLPAPSLLPRNLPLRPRLVHGEILQGQNEELFERIGNRIRRLSQLVSGPNGEILDMADFGLLTRQRRAHVLAKPAADNDEETQTEAENNSKATCAGATFRILFPEPGQWRVVPFGAFKQMLTSQLAHPERLRDGHRLPCYVQVYEVTAPQRIENLIERVFGKVAFSGQLQPLTHAAVMQLQLAPLLPPAVQIARHTQRDPGMLLPAERVLRLQLATDPTANDAEPEKSAVWPVAELSSESTRMPTLKTTVPERFLKPWEFLVSREEALYDLSAASTFIGGFGCVIWRLIHWLAFRREFRKWQVLLNGKNVEEQLWAVRPPKGGLADRFIRAWAKNAIELGGYDPRNMLAEWQIFWKRKGV